MRHELQNDKVRFYIGDVRDRASVDGAMRGVDYVFSAAALKQVPSCEFFPLEAVHTNVLGANNVIERAVATGVERVVVLSTSGGWSRILYGGVKLGYVSAAYLRTDLAYPAVSLSVPHFRQTDSRWSWRTLGSSGKTIGKVGCATTSIAMMESYRTGTTVTPDVMCRRLTYTASGNVYWPSHYTLVTSFSLDTIYRLLSQGKPVMLGGKTASGGQHWIVVTGYVGGATLTPSGFLINDPGVGSRRTLGEFFSAYPYFYKMFYY
jgi:hypothetical protein